MRRSAAMVALVAVLLPALAQACAVCGANEKGQSNFLWPTIVMSLLPLGLVAGGVWWWLRRAGADFREEWADRDDTVGSAVPVTPPVAPPGTIAG